jgi:hypothetical protein
MSYLEKHICHLGFDLAMALMLIRDIEGLLVLAQ